MSKLSVDTLTINLRPGYLLEIDLSSQEDITLKDILERIIERIHSLEEVVRNLE